MPEMLIGGEWLKASAHEELVVVNPATEETVDSVPAGKPEDVELAVATAKRAFGEWSRTDVEKRAAILAKAAELIRENAKELAATLTSEQGKPIAEAMGEVTHLAHGVHYYAEAATKVRGAYQDLPSTLGPAYGLKGGLGTSSHADGDLVVGALAAVNALGEVVDSDGSVIAGSRAPREEEPGADPGPAGADPGPAGADPGPGNTTLVVVATNARLNKERANLLAQAAHEGISAAIRPAHTIWDGDTAFALATGELEADQRAIEAMAVEAVADAIRRGTLAATGVPGFPSAREVQS